jgi:hypothetical protein
LPADVPLRDLVNLTKLRWQIERDYQELKQELGFSHYEGRGWRGFHHHATLTIAAYEFLIAGRNLIGKVRWVIPAGPFLLYQSAGHAKHRCNRRNLSGVVRLDISN